MDPTLIVAAIAFVGLLVSNWAVIRKAQLEYERRLIALQAEETKARQEYADLQFGRANDRIESQDRIISDQNIEIAKLNARVLYVENAANTLFPWRRYAKALQNQVRDLGGDPLPEPIDYFKENGD